MKVDFNNIMNEKTMEEMLLNKLALGHLHPEASDYYTDIVFNNDKIDIQVSAHISFNGKKFKLNIEEFLKDTASLIDELEDKFDRIKSILE